MTNANPMQSSIHRSEISKEPDHENINPRSDHHPGILISALHYLIGQLITTLNIKSSFQKIWMCTLAHIQNILHRFYFVKQFIKFLFIYIITVYL